MGDPGVVHEHGQRLGRADLGDRVDTRASGQVGGYDPDFDVRVRIGERFQALPSATYDHQVVAAGSQALGEGPADSGGGAGDECELAHAIPFQLPGELTLRARLSDRDLALPG